MCIICMVYKNKYIVSGFRSDGCECPEIVYAESKDMAVPAYRWKMPKEYADRVVAWRFFKEGENPNQYM